MYGAPIWRDVLIFLSLFYQTRYVPFVSLFFIIKIWKLPSLAPALLFPFFFFNVLDGGKPSEAHHLQVVLLKRRLFQKVPSTENGYVMTLSRAKATCKSRSIH